MKHIDLTLEVLPAAKAAYKLIRPSFDIFVKQELVTSISDQLKTGKGELELDEAVKALNDLEREIAESIGMTDIATEFRIKGGFLWFKNVHGDKWYAKHDVFMAEPVGK